MHHALVDQARSIRSVAGNNMIRSGKYRHYKGKEYEVIGIAKHSETLEELVVYRALYGEGQIWVRPLQMFLEKVEVDGQKIPRFSPVGYAVKCLLIKNNDVLLVKQVKDNDDLWIFPGGKLEEGENPNNCVHREMKEELGINIEIIEKIGQMDNVWQGRRDLLYCFVCRVLDDRILIRKKEIREAKWFSLDKLPALGPTSIKMLELWLNNKSKDCGK